MPRLRLVHWKLREAASLIEVLVGAGYSIDYDEQFRPALLRQWRDSPPDAFVIDLSRLPSQGREIAIALRQSPRTRLIPIVFCGGLEEKIIATRRVLPDAAYCELPRLVLTVGDVLQGPPTQVVRPTAMMDRYRGRTAAQKLGIVESSTVALVDPPADFARVLGKLPSDVELIDNFTPETPVTLCFLHDPQSVGSKLSEVRRRASRSKLWILWRKGGKAGHGDVTERLVREGALDLGLVDYKVCSVDAIWTAMLFARKK